MNPIRRRRLHRQAAEGFERTRSTSHCAVEKLAHHYIQAGDYERGLKYAKQAAAAAERVSAFDEAIAAFGRARDCAEALGLVDEQLAMEEEIGKVCLLQGEMIPAGEHFERALALTTEPFVRARLQCQAASSLVTVGDQRGLDHLREALEVLDPSTHPLETANALASEGRFHHLAGRHKKAIELLTRAAELVAPVVAAETVTTHEASIISMLFGYLAGAYQHSGLFSDGDVWAHKAIEFGTAHNIPFAQALGFEYLGENAMNRGEFAEGLKNSLHEREIADRIHSRERRAWTHMCASLCESYLNKERAEREFVDGIALGESIGEVRLVVLMKGNYAAFLSKRGGSSLDQALQIADGKL